MPDGLFGFALGVAGLPERIRVKLRQHGECWLWTGRKNRIGYGYMSWLGSERVVHRIVWELLIGQIPEGKVLDHVRKRCRHRNCCNPAHLEPVTPKVNTHRGSSVLFRKKTT